MGERTFQLFATPPSLDARERREVEGEVERLRALVDRVPGRAMVRVRKNPTGLLGVYVSLLLEVRAQGLPPGVIIPLTVRLRYGRRQWFAFSQEALEAVSVQYEAGRSSWARARGRWPSAGRAIRDWWRAVAG